MSSAGPKRLSSSQRHQIFDKAEDGKSSGELTINIEFGGSKTAFK
nr:MAG TPA: hypothetical protein [Caudoviricetes sp.]